MRGRSRKSSGKLSDKAVQRHIRLLAVPVIVIVLLLVILLVDRGIKKEPQETVTVASTVAENPDEEPSVIDFTGYELKKDEIPELTALVQAYCHAKADCDPEALYRVFGQEKSEEELAEEKARMELVSRTVDDYANIACYHIDGPEPDTYVIYPYFEIQYKDAQTLMPSLSWSYARKDSEGQFYMTQEVDDSVLEYIAQISKSEPVSQLLSQTEEMIQGIIAGDAELQRIYREGDTQTRVAQ